MYTWSLLQFVKKQGHFSISICQVFLQDFCGLVCDCKFPDAPMLLPWGREIARASWRTVKFFQDWLPRAEWALGRFAYKGSLHDTYLNELGRQNCNRIKKWSWADSQVLWVFLHCQNLLFFSMRNCDFHFLEYHSKCMSCEHRVGFLHSENYICLCDFFIKKQWW